MTDKLKDLHALPQLDNGLDALHEYMDEKDRSIKSMDEAVRFAYGLSETRKEIDRITELAEKEISIWQANIDIVNDWKNSSCAPLLNKAEFFETMLGNYHVNSYMSAETEKEKKKLNSIKLPYGITLKSSKPQIKYEIADEESYIAYMVKNGLVEDQQPKLKWGELKKQLAVSDGGAVVNQDGEIITFLQAVEEDRKFEVKAVD